MAGRRKSRSIEKLRQKNKHNSNQVRIIGGEWRGRKLDFPSTTGLRPTGDRMRETLFNWLSPYIYGANAVDLFAGSGALGFESLSRGAKKATFVETDIQAVKCIRENLQILNSEASVLQQSAFDYLQSTEPNNCDLLFLDPPFADDLHNEIIQLIDSKKLMKQGAHIYIEAPTSTAIVIPPSWTVHREKVSGQVQCLLCHC